MVEEHGRDLQSRREEQGIEGERPGRREHRWSVCGAALWLGFRNSRGHSRVLLELEEERADGEAVALLGDGRGAKIRCPVSRLTAATSSQTELREMQPRPAHLRSSDFWRTATRHLWGEFAILSLERISNATVQLIHSSPSLCLQQEIQYQNVSLPMMELKKYEVDNNS